VSAAIARLRCKTSGLDAVTLDDQFEPGPQYGFLSWHHRHLDRLLRVFLRRESRNDARLLSGAIVVRDATCRE
jgi:hypothetical protein